MGRPQENSQSGSLRTPDGFRIVEEKFSTMIHYQLLLDDGMTKMAEGNGSKQDRRKQFSQKGNGSASLVNETYREC